MSNPKYIPSDEQVYLGWLEDPELFQILDETRPMRARCLEMTREIAAFNGGAGVRDSRGYGWMDTSIARIFARDSNRIYLLEPEQFRHWCQRLFKYRVKVKGRYLVRLFEGAQ